MFTWHLDRFARAATLCAVLAALLTGATGFLVDARASVDGALGALLVAALIIVIGAVVGSTVTSGAGTLLFGIAAALAQPGAAILGLCGVVLLAALMLVDLSISTRQAPLIDRAIWVGSAVTFLVVGALALGLSLMAATVANWATWQAALLPLGIVAVGYAIRLGAESHVKRVPR